jgi:hypothetical protein
MINTTGDSSLQWTTTFWSRACKTKETKSIHSAAMKFKHYANE